jgi:hypothetical protein
MQFRVTRPRRRDRQPHRAALVAQVSPHTNLQPIPPIYRPRQLQVQGCFTIRSVLATLSSVPKARSSGYTKAMPSKHLHFSGGHSTVYGDFRTYTFWRFTLAVELQDNEMSVSYSVNNGQSIDFFVPGRNQNFRWATHSVSDPHFGLHRPQCLDFSLGNSATASRLV